MQAKHHEVMQPSDMQLRLGRVIREARRKKGYSQESFADAVGLHRTYVGGVERGERNVSLHNLVRIASALDCSLSGLIRAAESESMDGPG